MYYQFKANTLVETMDETRFDIAVYTHSKWSEKHIETPIQQENGHYSKVECYGQNMYGLCMLNKKDKDDHFDYILCAESLTIIDDTHYVEERIKVIQDLKLIRIQNKYHFFRYLLDSLIDDDVQNLGKLEEQLEKLETKVLKNELNQFNSRLLSLKRETSRFYRFYHQLEDVASKLLENELDLFDENVMKSIQLINGKISRFKSEALVLKDYAIQIQESYQAQIGIQQNDVMKFLTIITAIFLPLTLIVGWYGMNFTHMPELVWQYGYPFVILLSILVIIICLLFFRKRKYL